MSILKQWPSEKGGNVTNSNNLILKKNRYLKKTKADYSINIEILCIYQKLFSWYILVHEHMFNINKNIKWLSLEQLFCL